MKDLESLQSQVAQNHGKELVDEQALQEMELLRQRVMQLEGQASTRSEDPAGQAAPDSALADLNAELMQEMKEVRRRVMELQVPCLLPLTASAVIIAAQRPGSCMFLSMREALWAPADPLLCPFVSCTELMCACGSQRQSEVESRTAARSNLKL